MDMKNLVTVATSTVKGNENATFFNGKDMGYCLKY